MYEIENLFGNYYDSLKNKKSGMNMEKMLESRSYSAQDATSSVPLGPQDEYFLQKQIRPVFGKQGLNTTPIGTHPDFIELEGTDSGTKNHYACTLFVDIKGSTRLSLLYPLEMVFTFKNAVIKTCVEIIRSFDGHVHRLMGDAVMAFFGGNNIDKENAIADAINCSITLRAILEESIKPWMENNGIDAKDFGFRIGCDFGDDHEVLWGSFGYENVGEVSATGLPVDMASKLQGLASKNQTMLGQGLLDYVNWPDKYSEVKTKEKSGEIVNLPVVTPNLTDSTGNPINYNMRLLSYENSLQFSALPLGFREKISGSGVKSNPAITYKCYTVIGRQRKEYISASKFMEKEVSLEFEVLAATRTGLFFPLRASFVKTNHGKDTPENERNIEQKEKVEILKKEGVGAYRRPPPWYSKAVFEEFTRYRGLHTMKCEIKDNNGNVLFRNWIGVMIK